MWKHWHFCATITLSQVQSLLLLLSELFAHMLAITLKEVLYCIPYIHIFPLFHLFKIPIPLLTNKSSAGWVPITVPGSKVVMATHWRQTPLECFTAFLPKLFQIRPQTLTK